MDVPFSTHHTLTYQLWVLQICVQDCASHHKVTSALFGVLKGLDCLIHGSAWIKQKMYAIFQKDIKILVNLSWPAFTAHYWLYTLEYSPNGWCGHYVHECAVFYSLSSIYCMVQALELCRTFAICGIWLPAQSSSDHICHDSTVKYSYISVYNNNKLTCAFVLGPFKR